MSSIPATAMTAPTGTLLLERRGWQMPVSGGAARSLRAQRATPSAVRQLSPGADIGFFCTLRGLELAEVLSRVTAALVGEGFRISADADVETVLSAAPEAKMLTIRPLRAWRHGRLIPPCRVIVFDEGDGHQTVGFMDPVAMLQAEDSKDVALLAVDARDRLLRVESALLAWAGAVAEADRGRFNS